MALRVVALVMEDGASPFADWFATPDPIAAAKVTTALVRMEQGNQSNVKWFRGIAECRIDWGPGYRIYLARDGKDPIVLLGGSTKRAQQSEIDRAVGRWLEYKRRKANVPSRR
jgi:putative addiction module killer protein